MFWCDQTKPENKTASGSFLSGRNDFLGSNMNLLIQGESWRHWGAEESGAAGSCRAPAAAQRARSSLWRQLQNGNTNTHNISCDCQTQTLQRGSNELCKLIFTVQCFKYYTLRLSLTRKCPIFNISPHWWTQLHFEQLIKRK